MLGRRAFIVLAASCVGSSGRASNAAIRRSTTSALTELVQKNTAKGFSGSILVARGNRLLLHGGFGTVGSRAVRRNDRFWISSIAKQFVSAAVLKLADQGKLKLTDPLSLFLSSPPSDKAGITVLQLLSHTSGFGQGYAGENQPNHDMAVSALLGEPLLTAPGVGFNYSNTNFDLATAIVETVAGIAFASFVRTQLWTPAGLSRTGFSGRETTPRVSPVPGGVPPRLQVEAWGEHGVFSSTVDLFHWYRALAAGQIVSVARVKQLFTPIAKISEGYAGLGWFIGISPAGNQMVFTRGNDDFGPNSLLYAYPDSGVVIVVLTHSGDADEETSWSRRILAEIQSNLNL